MEDQNINITPIEGIGIDISTETYNIDIKDENIVIEKKVEENTILIQETPDIALELKKEPDNVLNFDGEVVKIDANYPQAIEAARIATEKAEEAKEVVEGFDDHAAEKITEYDANASDKIADFNQNASEKTAEFNSNASSKTADFNTNASAKTTAFDENATSKTNTFNQNATDKTTSFNNNASEKTTAFNDNYTEKKAVIDSQVELAKDWATKTDGTVDGSEYSAKHYAEQAESELSGLSSRVTTIEGIIPSSASSSNQLTDKDYVDTQDNALQSQIDALVVSSDVFDIVGTYAELQAYDISTVPVNDIIKVLVDSTHSNAATYYRCVESGGVKSWSYIGSEGAYYTKAETNSLLDDKQDTLVSGTNIKTVNGNSLLGSGDVSISATATWGNITGTLSNQTDLNNALNAKANQDLSNLTSQGQNIANWSSNVANCITEIPQDIKLELNNGTLTLKAGSKVYVPNGAGVFDTRVFTQDISVSSLDSATGRFLLTYGQAAWASEDRFDYFHVSQMNLFSGPSQPTVTSANNLWYDTTNNVIKTTSNTGSTWAVTNNTFPICIVTASSGTITSIDQVFNGFGYIGSIVFALPGVKGLVPNGRNADGTLKSRSVTTQSVLTVTMAVTGVVGFRENAVGSSNKYIYDEENNQNLNDGAYWNVVTCGNMQMDNGRITSFTPKTAFHAVDYNDYQALSNEVDTNTSNIALKQDKATAINYNNITNCITEIPQDIKLELNNGTLTLKTGSKVYVPNGAGVFDTITTTSDITSTQTLWGAGKYFIVLVWGNRVNFIRTDTIVSGTVAPTPYKGTWWYDITNNKLKEANGTSWNDVSASLPLALVTSTDGSVVASMDQVFNGFGYIGSTVFALPGVKGLIPNGRNADGSLKNTELVVTNVRAFTIPSDSYDNCAYFVISLNGNTWWADVHFGGNRPAGQDWRRWYDEDNNYWWQYVSGWYTVEALIISNFVVTGGVISNYNSKTPFHALDYSDGPMIAGWSMPSSRYIDLTLGASDSTYTAPANGYFCFNGRDSSDTGTAEVVLRNQTRFFGVAGTNTNSARTPAWTGYILPAKKGDTVYFYYQGTLALNNTNWAWRFYYAEGEA